MGYVPAPPRDSALQQAPDSARSVAFFGANAADTLVRCGRPHVRAVGRMYTNARHLGYAMKGQSLPKD